ncbi:MAG: hypothetical protein RMN51_06760 [Verrucomicrobiota bacterium]|nr:hypothetical protein [Limisphaera sp.]MDW8381792.1 hypothetical protein [Verrucomicrobiota bacterium]
MKTNCNLMMGHARVGHFEAASRLFALSWLCIWGGVCLWGAPLQSSDVPREPLWILHLDLDFFRQTTLGQHVLAELDKEENRKKLAAFQAIFRLDPRTALHGLTLYSTSKAQEDGVLLVYADVDVAQLTALAQGAKDHQTMVHRNHTIHHWVDDKRPPKSGVPARTYAAIYQSRIVLFSQRPDRMKEALDVLDRQQASLSMNPQLAAAVPQQAVLAGVALGGGAAPDDPQAALLRKSRMVTLALTEMDGKIQGRFTLETDGDEVAAQVENILRGLIGLMALQQNNPDAQRLAGALRVQRQQAVVTVELSIPVTELLDRMRSASGLAQSRS